MTIDARREDVMIPPDAFLLFSPEKSTVPAKDAPLLTYFNFYHQVSLNPSPLITNSRPSIFVYFKSLSFLVPSHLTSSHRAHAK